MGDTTPNPNPKRTIDAGDTVRLIKNPHFDSAPEIVDGIVSSSGKTMKIENEHGKNVRLDREEIDELRRPGGCIYRGQYNYSLYTPERFRDACEKKKQAHPLSRTRIPDVDDIRQAGHKATHAPANGRYAPGGQSAPDAWNGLNTPTDADVATDGGTDADDADTLSTSDDAHDMAAWLPWHGPMDAEGETAYIAEITGESRKYGLQRDFVTDKDDSAGTRTLRPSAVFEGGVYEIKHEGASVERTYHVVESTRLDDNGELDEIETVELAGGDEALEALNWERDPETERLAEAITKRVENMNGDELRALANRLGVRNEVRDPTQYAATPLDQVPDDVADRIADTRKAFRATFEKQFDGATPDAKTRAAVIDATALVEKRRRQ